MALALTRRVARFRPRMLRFIHGYFFGRQELLQDKRVYSTKNAALDAHLQALWHPRLSALILLLDGIAPRFSIESSQIKVLTLPADFYNTLKEKISTALSRIFLSSLYLGKTEDELVDCLAQALQANERLELHVLIDALRGTREAPHLQSLASLLVGLVERFGKHRVNIRMYHTPHLAGFKKSWAPKRLNESFGLQHMKLYGFDDEIMLSGANLSEDYFTDRQDRYYLFKDEKLADYYYKIHEAVSKLSYQLVTTANPTEFQNFFLSWPSSNASCEPGMNLQRFISDSSFLLEPLIKQHSVVDLDENEALDRNDSDTYVYAVSQFSPLLQPKNDVSTEKPSILRLFSLLDSPHARWWFTAGYFNLLPEFLEKLLNGRAPGTLITASAKANSFYKSPGLSYYIPEAYLLIAKRFLEDVRLRGKELLVKLYEWQNGVVNTVGGWTYHAKGIWITVPGNEAPSITVIGSSNYTKRSYSLDLETNAIIVTRNDELKKKMMGEIEHLMTYALPLTLEDFEPKKQLSAEPKIDAQGQEVEPPMAIDEDRRISFRVHLALRLFGGRL